MWRSKQLLPAGTESLKVLKPQIYDLHKLLLMASQAYFYESDMYTLGLRTVHDRAAECTHCDYVSANALQRNVN